MRSRLCRIWAVPESEKALGRKEVALSAHREQIGSSIIIEQVVRPHNVAVLALHCHFIHSCGRISRACLYLSIRLNLAFIS